MTKTKINPARSSKINWTALVIVAINLAVAADIIPPEYEYELTMLANSAGPALILIFRTWFTEPKA